MGMGNGDGHLAAGPHLPHTDTPLETHAVEAVVAICLLDGDHD